MRRSILLTIFAPILLSCSSSNESDIKKEYFVDVLLEKIESSKKKIIFINEIHKTPFHRYTTECLIKGISETLGPVQFFAAETFLKETKEYDGKEVFPKKYGYYVNEPFFAELLYTSYHTADALVAYDMLPGYNRPPEFGLVDVHLNRREAASAKHLNKFMKELQSGHFMIIHTGPSHNNRNNNGEVKWVATILESLLNYNIFTIKQDAGNLIRVDRRDKIFPGVELHWRFDVGDNAYIKSAAFRADIDIALRDPDTQINTRIRELTYDQEIDYLAQWCPYRTIQSFDLPDVALDETRTFSVFHAEHKRFGVPVARTDIEPGQADVRALLAPGDYYYVLQGPPDADGYIHILHQQSFAVTDAEARHEASLRADVSAG
ncbi:MAG: hypothetical protein ACFB2Z_06240 [Maricaulaceae bacterium]